MLTQRRLIDLLLYDPATGEFLWKDKSSAKSRVSNGQVAGHERSDGYRVIKVDRGTYKAHRLAWLYVYGEFPKNGIDHINHKRGDNRIKNLRDVSQSNNNKNASRRRDNRSGKTGVTWHKSVKKWIARIMVDTTEIAIGSYEKIEDAINARKEAEEKYGFHKNHGS